MLANIDFCRPETGLKDNTPSTDAHGVALPAAVLAGVAAAAGNRKCRL
jgi:hypothetical protein